MHGTQVNSPRRCSLDVVTPCFNEVEGIQEFYAELAKELRKANVDFRVLMVDDGSSDGTLEKLMLLERRERHVRVLSLSRNFGHQIALTAGLDRADADAVVLMDSDLQHPPAVIHKLLEQWKNGFDIVLAAREETVGASWFKRTSSKLFYRFFNRLTGVELVPGAADFCLLSRRAHQALNKMPERHRFLRGMIAWIGFPRTFVPYVASERFAGESKYTCRAMFRFASDALFSFSPEPMRYAMRGGLLIGGAGCLYFFYIIARAFWYGDLVPGWASVVCVLLILGGVQLTFFGVMGEYLARVFEETKGRPLFFLKYETKQRPTEDRAVQVSLTNGIGECEKLVEENFATRN